METEKSTENVWKAEQKNKENVENQAYQISQERALEMLEELLEQDQFELLLPEYKLVYLMNDAVESFLVFHGARMTGIYQDDYEGPLDASVTYENGEYVLVVHQDDSVITLFYQSLSVEVHLYNYGEIGHFWVKGAEYLRQIEYKIAIVRDKLDYLGAKYCNQTERKLAVLADFPPLNYCCYPAVSEQYVVPRGNPWIPSAEAHQVMQGLAATVEDKKLLRCLKFYQKHPWKRSAKKIAGMLQEKRHAEVTDLLMEELKMAAANYPRRKFTDEEENQNRKTEKRASERKRELEEQGFRINIFREEPFIASRDSLQYKISLMIWEKKGKKRKVQIEEFSADRRG